MQTLRTYMQATAPERKHREWAEILGTSRSHFCEVVNGTCRPGWRLIQAINTMTGGQVPPAVWYLDEGDAEATSPVPSEMQSINAPDSADADAVRQAVQTVNKRGRA